jgi:hypothetical protein
VIDPETGLTPERYRADVKWSVANAAADMYSSLVMIAAFTDREALEDVLRRALLTERQRAQRIGPLPDDLHLKTLEFVHAEPSLRRSIFGASEWCRDGLLRITENLGPKTPWQKRMEDLAAEIIRRAPKETRFGPVPRGDHEVDGEMLQILSRLYWITGDARYRQWAERIGDAHLFDEPPQQSTRLRLRDHGGEIIAGLAELFVMTWYENPAKADRYRPVLRDLLDRVLEVGRAPDGMLYDVVNLKEGTVTSSALIDTWGYVYNAHLAYDMVTGENRYRPRIIEALRSLSERYMDHRWGGSDDYADSIESAIVLDNRLHVEGVEAWITKTIPQMWAMQKPDGTVNRRYDDGSFARTSILVAGLASQGIRAEPWREDLRLGAAADGRSLHVTLCADAPWTGRLRFDHARSRRDLHLPLNYPRINELPEWMVVAESASYEVTVDGGPARRLKGSALIEGLPLEVEAASELRLLLRTTE